MLNVLRFFVDFAETMEGENLFRSHSSPHRAAAMMSNLMNSDTASALFEAKMRTRVAKRRSTGDVGLRRRGLLVWAHMLQA